MELQFPQPLPQLDHGRNRNPEPGAYPDANTDVHEHAGEDDAGEHGEGLAAPGFMHDIG